MSDFISTLQSAFPFSIIKSEVGEVTMVLNNGEHYIDALRELRDQFKFEILIDLAGVDLSTMEIPLEVGNLPRFAVVLHLLSIHHNHRLRLRVYASGDEMPMIDSAQDIYPNANWYEREAFDLYGILFNNHNDLRRILTDYGFIGHPFRKDFPVSGYVEVRYDENLKRVVYQPVSIPPREITPRIVREPGYGGIKG